MDVTLDEVKALEENQAYQPVERRSPAKDLNPYQAVPPIQMEESTEQVTDGGYSQIHQVR